MGAENKNAMYIAHSTTRITRQARVNSFINTQNYVFIDKWLSLTPNHKYHHFLSSNKKFPITSSESQWKIQWVFQRFICLHRFLCTLVRMSFDNGKFICQITQNKKKCVTKKGSRWTFPVILSLQFVHLFNFYEAVFIIAKFKGNGRACITSANESYFLVCGSHPHAFCGKTRTKFHLHVCFVFLSYRCWTAAVTEMSPFHYIHLTMEFGSFVNHFFQRSKQALI